MNNLLKLTITAAALMFSLTAFAQQSEEERVEALLQQMTLQEKIGQLNQLSVGGFDPNAAGMMRAGMVGSILNECNPKVLNRYQKAAVEESRLGIPLIISRDVIHGFKTMFPIPLGLAATFDPELVEQGARVAAVEATASGIRWTFSPMLDIARDPRWGRIAEGSGEDTYLDAQMGVAMVNGYKKNKRLNLFFSLLFFCPRSGKFRCSSPHRRQKQVTESLTS